MVLDLETHTVIVAILSNRTVTIVMTCSVRLFLVEWVNRTHFQPSIIDSQPTPSLRHGIWKYCV